MRPNRGERSQWYDNPDVAYIEVFVRHHPPCTQECSQFEISFDSTFPKMDIAAKNSLEDAVDDAPKIVAKEEVVPSLPSPQQGKRDSHTYASVPSGRSPYYYGPSTLVTEASRTEEELSESTGTFGDDLGVEVVGKDVQPKDDTVNCPYGISASDSAHVHVNMNKEYGVGKKGSSDASLTRDYSAEFDKVAGMDHISLDDARDPDESTNTVTVREGPGREGLAGEKEKGVAASDRNQGTECTGNTLFSYAMVALLIIIFITEVGLLACIIYGMARR